jgi:hypothetical protein
VTVRPLDSFDLGPVGLRQCQYNLSSRLSEGLGILIPNNYRPLFVVELLMCCRRCNKWFGRPVLDQFVDLLFQHQRMFSPPLHERTTYRICELHFLLRAVLWRKQIPHSEEKQEQLNCASYGVILVARLDVAHGDGGTGNALEMRIRVGKEAQCRVLCFVEIHGKARQLVRVVVAENKFWVEFRGCLRRIAEVQRETSPNAVTHLT